MKNIRIWKKVPVWVLVLLFSLISLFPYYIMIIMGTYRSEDIFHGLKLLPGNYFLKNLKTVFQNNFARYYLNSAIVAVSATLGGTFICALTGYTFAKLSFPGKKFLFRVVLATIMIPMQLGLVGFLMEMRMFGLNDTHWPLIIPPMANAFGVYWMRSYIQRGVPTEMLESARVDGASEFRIFLQIALPIIKPALITIFLYLFLQNWNSYLIPLVVISSEDLYTIPLAISKLSEMFRVDYGSRILALAVATLPVIAIFAIGSKYLIAGLTAGSIKE